MRTGFAFVVLFGLIGVNSFYLPGIAPRNFPDGSVVEVKVNRLSSKMSLLPFDYYSLPVCRPPKVFGYSENLGEILRGDRIENSPYNLTMKVAESGKALCAIDPLTKDQAELLAKRIQQRYRVHMIIDNMPAATKIETSKGQFVYQTGFPLGVIVDGAAYVHNHIVFTVLYHEEEKSKGNNRVVGFEARGYSVAHPSVGAVKSPVGMDKYKPQPVREKEAIVYSYDVVWEKSDVKWATRWDNYLKMQDAQVHWFSIINSLLIIFFLTGMVALILVRVLRRDFARYNGLETAEEAVEETGWKLVYGDVFRAPRFFGALSVLVGVGCQITMMCVVTIIFAAIGYLSPARRGYLLTACIIFFDVSSLFAGYYSARFYKFFKGTSWKSNTLYAAFAFPLTIFGIFLVLNHLHSKEDSTGAVPVRSLLMLMGVWFSLSTPLAHLGAYWGYRKEEFEVPVRTNQIPRQVPDQPWYMNSVLVCLVGGVMPFGACLIELYFILGSLYQNQSYYLFGFLLLVFIIVAVTCAEITIVFAYFQLCSEDYHWWWRSFLTAGASAGYVFLYSLNYLSKLQFDRTVDRALFVGYTLIISLGFFAMTGTIGFLASFAFLRTIYGAIKID